MQKYVIDLETAKKLKDYLPEGFEGEFIWTVPTVKELEKLTAIVHKNNLVHRTYGQHMKGKFEEHYPAPILEEMLELLPENLIIKGKSVYRRDFIGNCICYINVGDQSHGRYLHSVFITESVNFATAAAKLYMWLVDEGYHIP
jgi:hypothetical protein